MSESDDFVESDEFVESEDDCMEKNIKFVKKEQIKIREKEKQDVYSNPPAVR